jgi:hypothetical protein
MNITQLRPIFMVLTLFLLYGCTEEKAKAIKVSASSFNNEAQIALDQVEEILIGNMAMPPIEVEKIVQDLEDTKDDFSVKIFSEFFTERNIGKNQEAKIENAISEIRNQYVLFASVFRSLDKGKMLAADSVKLAEKHCINLSLQLIALADLIDQGQIEVRLNSERILLYEKITNDQRISDSTIRKNQLTISAKSIVQLQARENQVKQEAMLQLFKAAEIGKSTAELIRNYKKLSINEVLTLVEENLTLAAALSEQNPNVTSLLTRYKEVENTIRNDPYWSPLLEKRISIN